jgi:hypothetical protein
MVNTLVTFFLSSKFHLERFEQILEQFRHTVQKITRVSINRVIHVKNLNANGVIVVSLSINPLSMYSKRKTQKITLITFCPYAFGPSGSGSFYHKRK